MLVIIRRARRMMDRPSVTSGFITRRVPSGQLMLDGYSPRARWLTPPPTLSPIVIYISLSLLFILFSIKEKNDVQSFDRKFNCRPEWNATRQLRFRANDGRWLQLLNWIGQHLSFMLVGFHSLMTNSDDRAKNNISFDDWSFPSWYKMTNTNSPLFFLPKNCLFKYLFWLIIMWWLGYKVFLIFRNTHNVYDKNWGWLNRFLRIKLTHFSSTRYLASGGVGMTSFLSSILSTCFTFWPYRRWIHAPS